MKGIDLKKTDTLPVITMLSMVYYAFSKGRALDKKITNLRKGIRRSYRTKCRKMKVVERSWKRC